MKTEDIFIDDNLFDNTDQTEINKVSEDVLQDTNIDQNKALFVDLPEEWPEKVKITPRKITPNARLEVPANRILKKYQRQRQTKEHSIKSNNKAIKWLKKTRLLRNR